ncbi:MAG: cation transporter [Defluviitaleaceae bacterium]|nr:cation transporter [Defluviitaleaceae bacterium]
MKKISLTVEGMSCSHCEKAVINALEDLGVSSVKASAQNSLVDIEFDESKLSLETIKKEIVETGYMVA